MNLSTAQKLSLRDWRKRVMAESAQALRRRTGLLQRLSCQMVGDDGESMPRLTAVRNSTKACQDLIELAKWHRLLLSCCVLGHCVTFDGYKRAC